MKEATDKINYNNLPGTGILRTVIYLYHLSTGIHHSQKWRCQSLFWNIVIYIKRAVKNILNLIFYGYRNYAGTGMKTNLNTSLLHPFGTLNLHLLNLGQRRVATCFHFWDIM